MNKIVFVFLNKTLSFTFITGSVIFETLLFFVIWREQGTTRT